jgi:hypothetical protein
MLADGHPQTGGFERTGPLVVFLEIVPEYGGSYQTVSLPHILRRRGQEPKLSTLRKAIQARGRSRL